MTHADLYSALFALISSQGKDKTNYRRWVFIYFDFSTLNLAILVSWENEYKIFSNPYCIRNKTKTKLCKSNFLATLTKTTKATQQHYFSNPVHPKSPF